MFANHVADGTGFGEVLLSVVGWSEDGWSEVTDDDVCPD